MNTAFNASKLLQTIILNEKMIAQYYRQLSNEMKDGKGKNLFQLLAEDEDRHEKMYTSLLNKLPNAGILELSEEESGYINALIEFNMFKDSKDVLDTISERYSKEDALAVAEKVERDGIMLIYELQKLYPDLAPKEIETILREEKKHLQAVLSRQMDSALKILML